MLTSTSNYLIHYYRVSTDIARICDLVYNLKKYFVRIMQYCGFKIMFVCFCNVVFH